jgi:UDP-N-acetylmuramoyl-L-alanyl-D-glutamate--2,6-diaminopimelate ligase
MDRLLEDVDVVSTRGTLTEAEVTSVAYDSRGSSPGAMFCCVRGEHTDGHDHAASAVTRGAIGLLVERTLDLDVPQAVVVPGTMRKAMARAAATLNGHPSASLTTVGVTGTNGKTTVTHLLASIFEQNRMPTTVIGTLGGARTTPESPDLQRMLADARDSGKKAASLEVSSHALTQDRVEGIRFDAAVFTNLGHDHLDHHGSMEDYFAAKASLFTPERARLGVVRSDDRWGAKLIAKSQIEIVPYSIEDATDVVADSLHTTFTWRGHEIALGLAGLFQVANALAAATTAVALGVSEDVVATGLAATSPVAGRFEVIDAPVPFTIVVDYAHTPEGLEVALESARGLARYGRVILVFGAGGDRDHEKRPAMGAAASSGADVVFVTSDNPRGEDPERIIDEVLSGVSASSDARREVDRGRAIESAIQEARPGDVVLIAGKGHETEIEAGGRRTHFDDREVAHACASRLAAAGGGEMP